MKSREFRKLARENLSGRWGKAAITMFVFGLCSFLVALVGGFIPIIGSIAVTIITPVLSYGLLKQWINFKNKEDVGYLDFFKLGFEDFGKVWGVAFRVALKMIFPLLLVILGYIVIMSTSIIVLNNNDGILPLIMSVLGIVMVIAGFICTIPVTYKYMFSQNELAYNSARTSKEIVEESGKYMVGNRFKAFALTLSFFGWMLLSGILFCIPLFWVMPYMQITTIIFYEHVSGRTNENKEEVAPEMPNVIAGQ